MKPSLLVIHLGCCLLLACSSIDYSGLGDAKIGTTASISDHSFLSEELTVGYDKNKNYKPILTVKEPKRFKDFLCKRNRVLKQRIVAVVPSFPGLAIAKAAEYQEECRNNVREIVKTFYGRMVHEPYGSEEQYYVTGSDLSLEVKLSRDSLASGEHRVIYRPVFYPSAGKTFVYPMNALGIDYEESPSDAALRRANLEKSRFAEVTALFENFVPILPELVLREVTKGEPTRSVEECDSDHILSNGEGQYCWSYVFNYATSVKEAPEKGNPNVINFDVTLDLDLFCKYGRPTRDIISK